MEYKYVIFMLCLSMIEAQPKTRIVGGFSAPEGKYPYQALIKIGDRYQCGASIFNKRYILTAAHCVTGQQASLMTVEVGTNSRVGEKGDIYNIATYEAHANYSFPTPIAPVNDIALIRLKKDITFNDKVRPVQLPTNSSDFSTDFLTLTGWGHLKYLGASPIQLQELNVTKLEKKICREKWKDYRKVTIVDSQICTFTEVGRGACVGDSGGPLMAGNVQVGIVSFGGTPCGKNIPDVFTRLTSYIDWINGRIY